MNTHTHTHSKKVESSGRQNGHRHPTLYFILLFILQDAKYIIIMLYSRWRTIHQSVNWCGWLYTRPGFTEKWSTAWEQKQMKCVYMCVVSVHLSDHRQGYLCERKIIRIIYYTHKKKVLIISPYFHHPAWFQSTVLSFNAHIHKAFNASGLASILHLEQICICARKCNRITDHLTSTGPWHLMSSQSRAGWEMSPTSAQNRASCKN